MVRKSYVSSESPALCRVRTSGVGARDVAGGRGGVLGLASPWAIG